MGVTDHPVLLALQQVQSKIQARQGDRVHGMEISWLTQQKAQKTSVLCESVVSFNKIHRWTRRPSWFNKESTRFTKLNKDSTIDFLRPVASLQCSSYESPPVDPKALWLSQEAVPCSDAEEPRRKHGAWDTAGCVQWPLLLRVVRKQVPSKYFCVLNMFDHMTLFYLKAKQETGKFQWIIHPTESATAELEYIQLFSCPLEKPPLTPVGAGTWAPHPVVIGAGTWGSPPNSLNAVHVPQALSLDPV